MGKFEQDIYREFNKQDKAEERADMIDMMATSIIEDDRIQELFEEEKVLFASVNYIQSLLNDSDQETTLGFFETMKDEIEREAEETADKLLKEDGR